jgi:hypothetical protein
MILMLSNANVVFDDVVTLFRHCCACLLRSPVFL